MKVEHLIFDLDNTLYPANDKMAEGIHKRMISYVCNFFKLEPEDALKLRKEKINRYSTTLEWLRDEGLSDIEDFLAYVHPENEADELCADNKLRPFLEGIEIPKIILTNAPFEHADRVLNKLGVKDLFDDICDIRACDFLGKPYRSAYEKALKMAGGNIENSLFLDDMQKYADGFTSMGGTAVLIGDKNGMPLSKDSAARFKGFTNNSGKIFKLKDIYGLGVLLEEIEGSEKD